jgi:hypothetical protein
MSARKLAALVLLLLLSPACGDDEAAGPEPVTYDDVIDSGGEFVEVDERSEVTDSMTATELRPDAQGRLENWLCTTRTYDVTKAPEEFPLFDPNSEVIFPGNLLQGKSLEQATPDPIPVRRGSGTIVVTLMNGAPAGVSRTVDEVTLSEVYDGANQIIYTNPGDIPARFAFTMERVDSKEQLAMAANVKVEWFSGSIAASLKFSRDREYSRFLVKLTQSFYTIAFELPTWYGQMFAEDVTPDELAQYVGPGNPAAFISSVTYGRIFYLLIESTERVDEMEASINASFSGFVDVEAGGEVKYVGELSHLSVKAFALGGDASKAISAVTSDFEDLKNFLAEGGNIRTGVPISYVVRSVRNPERIVKVGVNTRYDVRDCRPIRETFGVPIIWLMAEDPNIETHASDSTRVTRWPDISVNENDAYVDIPVSTDRLPQLLPNSVNGEMPAVSFGDSATLRFVGADFAESDYTLSLVAAFTLNPYYGHLFDFICGSTPSPGRMLRAGFLEQDDPYLDPVEFGFDHFEGRVKTDRIPYPAQYHVYTLVFSRTRGMSIYVDGHEAVWDPFKTEPLEDFLGARIGNVLRIPDASVAIAELIAYGIALDDEQRRFLEDDMMRRYKF